MAGSLQAEIIGYIGGFFLAVCCIPQFFKMYENQSAKDVSLLYTVLYTVGLVFTLTYMIMLEATAAIITISFEVAVALAVLFLKFYFDRKHRNDVSLLAAQEKVVILDAQTDDDDTKQTVEV